MTRRRARAATAFGLRAPVLFFAGALASLSVLASPGITQQTAEFTVTPAPAPHAPSGILDPVTLTIHHASNGVRDLSPQGGAMEPPILRRWFTAVGGTATELHTNRFDATFGSTIRAGALDGAEVDILRAQNGRLVRVRKATIAQGGHQPNPWFRLYWQNDILDPSITSIRLPVPQFWRDNVSVRFGLQAVDRAGRPSEIGMSNSITVPARADRAQGPRPNGFIYAQRFDSSPNARSVLASAPRNLQANVTEDGHIDLRWDKPNLISGLSTEGFSIMASFDGTTPYGPSRMVFEKEGPPVQAGDIVMLRTKLEDMNLATGFIGPAYWYEVSSQARSHTLFPEAKTDGTTENWSLVEHDPDTPVADPGTHYLTAQITPAQPLKLFAWTFGPTRNAWRPALEPNRDYEIGMWLRAPSGKVTARIEFPHFLQVVEANSGLRLPTTSIEITEDWTHHTIRFRSTAVSVEAPSGVTIHLEGDGQVHVDNVTKNYAGSAPGRLPPSAADDIRASGMGHLRSHGLIKTGAKTYDMTRLLGVPTGQTSADSGVGLVPLLELAEAAGTQPWIQLEPHMSAEEWQALVEYLAAPWNPDIDTAETKPWAALRARQGRVAPWTDSFESILFELGNEMWNSLFRPWVAFDLVDSATGAHVPRGGMLGMYHAYVMEAMSQSPYWDQLEPKLDTVIGGWAINPAFGVSAARRAAHAGWPVDYVATTAYVGGWDEGESVVKDTRAGYNSVLANGVQVGTRMTRLLRDELATLAQEGLSVPEIAIYEGGPGYVLNGLNGQSVSPEQAERQERVMKSHASGTATLDSLLVRATEGTAIFNFFAYGPGDRWTSHTAPADGRNPVPSWDWLSVFNKEMRGEVLSVNTQSVPRGTIPARARQDPLPDAPLIGLHALRNGDRLSIIAVSRYIPDGPTGGGTDVTVNLPIKSAQTLTRWSLTGRYDDHDIGENRVAPERAELAVPQDTSQVTINVPAGTAVAYVLDGVTW